VGRFVKGTNTEFTRKFHVKLIVVR